jgi:hypothetical protein
MRFASVLLGVAVALALTAGPVRADEKSQRAAIKELFQVMDLPKTMQSSMDQMLDVQIKTRPGLKAYRDVMRKFLAKHLSYEALENDLISLYAKEFTENEIKEMTAFYKTPVGKKVIKSMPTLLAKGAQLGAARVQANQEELKKMIEEASKGK